jgi:PTH2 family peptidyl-tRNA hydrolase
MSLKPNPLPMKQVIVVNESLKLPRGKLAAQVAHASVGALLETNQETRQAWIESGMAKVVLKVETEADLLRLYELARRQHLPAQLVEDAGRTVVPAGTMTCLGLGPADDSKIDQLTGDLKLLR